MKFFVIIFTVLFSMFLTSCNSVREITVSDELTKTEYQQLLARARKYIQMVNHLRISKEDKLFVQENLPKSYIQYTGYKQGMSKMLWKINPSYSIRIINKGDLMDEKCLTRLTVSRFKQ